MCPCESFIVDISRYYNRFKTFSLGGLLLILTLHSTHKWLPPFLDNDCVWLTPMFLQLNHKLLVLVGTQQTFVEWMNTCWLRFFVGLDPAFQFRILWRSTLTRQCELALAPDKHSSLCGGAWPPLTICHRHLQTELLRELGSGRLNP